MWARGRAAATGTDPRAGCTEQLVQIQKQIHKHNYTNTNKQTQLEKNTNTQLHKHNFINTTTQTQIQNNTETRENYFYFGETYFDCIKSVCVFTIYNRNIIQRDKTNLESGSPFLHPRPGNIVTVLNTMASHLPMHSHQRGWDTLRHQTKIACSTSSHL